MSNGTLNNSFEPLSDGNGGFVPCLFLLTESEAILFLRLDKQKAQPFNTLAHYREKHLLRATILGKNRFYMRTELERFLETLTNNSNEYKRSKR